jgi:hypothetical protein
MGGLDVLRNLLEHLPSRLNNLPREVVIRKPAPNRWSPQEELGHLLDSAANNHQRIVRTQLEDKPAMPGYEGDRWVVLYRYQQRDCKELVETWHAFNSQLLTAAQAVQSGSWQRTCTIANSQPVTLQFVFEDYIHHIVHHLRHIGVEVDDLLSSLPEFLGPWKPWPGGKPPAQER